MPEPSPEVVEALFQQAADLAPEQRGAFLDERCSDNPELRAAVEELLFFDAKAQSSPDFLNSPAAAVRAAFPMSAWEVPATIGRYRIVRSLGEGGMGTVYEAEQDDPRRTVALKVMRPGLDSLELRKRFAQEARILGQMHHVGIAQVYDAGTIADGRLYFAMEFIRGLPLDEHLLRTAPDVRARLELMARVCDAVQHAHEHGVVHRDLKPANVLVDETGQPKILDFGVAHATGAGIFGSTAHTRTGQLIGTLGYMSPEQVATGPHEIDARSDVYALGVILYELLANRLPYELDHLAIPLVVRVILEVEPSRLGSVNRHFRGEVETIVAKALEKDRARRYQSAGALGEDLRRYLAHEPIRARPASALYRVRKFVGRHQGLVAGTAVVFTALLAATIVSLMAARDARQSARLARSQAYQARLAAAVAALSSHDVADAARQLDRAPAELRGWEWRHLSSRLDDSFAVVPLRPGDPALLLPGPGGLRVGTFTEAGLRFTDERGKEALTQPFPNLRNQLFSIVSAGDGWRLAATDGHRVTLLDQTGRALRHIDNRGSVIVSLALSVDRKRLALARMSAKGISQIVVCDPATGEELAHCAGHAGQVYALAFSPDGKRLASGGDDRVVRIWDTATGRFLAECNGHTSKILSIEFRGDGVRLLTASHDGTVRQWDPGTGRPVEPPYDRHTAEVFTAVYSPDGQRVASAGADRTIRLWRATGRQDQEVLRGHTGSVSALAFSSDGRRLVSASYDATIAQADSTVRFWEAAPGDTLPVLAGHTSYVYPVAFSPDGLWIASGGWDNTVRLWDAATGEACAKLPQPGFVRALAFGPDSTWLVSAGDFPEGPLLWNVATGHIRGRLTGVGRSVRSLAVSPDGSRIALGEYESETRFTMSIWDTASLQRIGVGEGLPLAFSPDGRWLAGRGTDEKTIVLWDTRDFHVAARWPGHTDQINTLAFRRDGQRLVSASNDRTVRLWDVATGQCVRTFEGHTDMVYAVAFHPDGTRIASAGRDRAIWLWDPASDRAVARLPGHTSYVWSLDFSPDGRTLVSGSGDGSVRLWDTEPLRVRYQARRDAAKLRPEAEQLVEKLFQEKIETAAVEAAVRGDRSLSEPQRMAALRELLRRCTTHGR